MKKIIALVLSLALLVSCAMVISFADDKIVAEGICDQQIIVKDGKVVGGTVESNPAIKFVASGDVIKYVYNAELDPQFPITFDEDIDHEKYPILAFKAKEEGLTGAEGIDIFYNVIGEGATAAQMSSTKWEVSEDYQWIVFDMSNAACDYGFIRFDPRGVGSVGVNGQLAAVLAFDSMDNFNAFANSDAGKALGTHPGSETVAIDKKYETKPLYVPGTFSTGWWVNGPYREAYLYVDITATDWFSGISMNLYVSKNEAQYNVYVTDMNGKTLFETAQVAKGDATYSIPFLDAEGNEVKFQPGDYEIVFETVPYEDEDLNNGAYIVFGSASADESVYNEVTAEGCNTNDNTREVAAIGLILCEPGEITTPAPTEAPTATPEATATPAHTAAPTEAPTAAPTEAPAKSGCGSILSGSAIIALLGAAVLVFKKRR